MLLMPNDIRELLPKLGATADIDTTPVPLKLFDPSGRLTYYVTEYDGADALYGYMVSPLGKDCDEWGYSSLEELTGVKGRFGLGIERDLRWDPKTTVGDLRERGVFGWPRSAHVRDEQGKKLRWCVYVGDTCAAAFVTRDEAVQHLKTGRL